MTPAAIPNTGYTAREKRLSDLPTDERSAVIERIRSEIEELPRGKTSHDIGSLLGHEGFSPADAAQIVAEARERSKRIADNLGKAAEQTYHALDDIGNAKRLVDRHGHEIRYVAENKRWLAWNQKVWTGKGAAGAVERHAKRTALDIYAEAARARMHDAELAKQLAKWAHSSCNRSRLESMMQVARSDVEVDREALDADPWALNVQNGIVDLKTGERRPHDPAELHSRIAAAAYYPDAKAEHWERFLEEVLPDDEVRSWFQRALGYSACGEVGEHILPFPYGTGANGKSVALGVARIVLGDYATEAAPDLLVARRERGIPTDIMDLRGYRFVTTSEVEDRRMDTTVMKRLTGESILRRERCARTLCSFAT